jgi:predicted O-linked N-acetylglucosamine transferase (SPINDLY family)
MVIRIRDIFKSKATAVVEVDDAFQRARSLQEQGHLVQATAAYQSILEQQPDHWDSLLAIATMTQQGGNPERAVLLYGEFIARHGDHAEAHYKRGNAYNALGQLAPALLDYDRAIAIDPAYANAYCNRGVVLGRLKRWEAALASYDRAIELNPADCLAFCNRGFVRKELGRFDEALADYERAISLKDDYVDAYVNRGGVLQELERYEAAVASYDRAIEIKPIHAEAFQGRGSSLLKLGRIEEAVASFDLALSLQPDYKYVSEARLHSKMQLCDWDDFAANLSTVTTGVESGKATMPFPLLALVDSPGLHRQAAEAYVRAECPPSNVLPAIPPRSRSDKIRIGYFSSDFRGHPVSYLTAELFELHDRAEFEIIAFAFGPESKDPLRERLQRAFDRFIDVRDRSDVEVALLARELGIDIAVDLGGFTEHCRPKIFAMRAAPIQASYIGYLGTMGATFMDYLLADATIIPAAQQLHYAEKIIYLPSYQANDRQRRISERVFTREDLGLPPTGFVFCCFNSLYKILPDTFAVWMRILQRVEGSSLYLSVDKPAAARNLTKVVRRSGLDPQRIVYGAHLDLPDYMARFRAMDLFLDTLPYNAGTTASDALWAGLPVLTCTGEAFAGRVAASILRAINMPELITATPAEYEQLAVQLATNAERMSLIHHTLAVNRHVSPLFDTPLFTKNLESAYRQVCERWQANLPPDHIYP